jgi:hypothetical protein
MHRRGCQPSLWAMLAASEGRGGLRMEQIGRRTLNSAERGQPPPLPERAPYKSPVLTFYGRVEDLTAGGSPGAGDSGSPSPQQPPGF